MRAFCSPLMSASVMSESRASGNMALSRLNMAGFESLCFSRYSIARSVLLALRRSAFVIVSSLNDCADTHTHACTHMHAIEAMQGMSLPGTLP